MDLLFDSGLVIQGGSFSLCSEKDRDRSHLRHYLLTRGRERVLSPDFGRQTQAMQPTISPGLLAEKERINLARYFEGVQVRAERIERTLRMTVEVGDVTIVSQQVG